MTEAKIYIHQIHDPQKNFLQNALLLVEQPVVREVRVNRDELPELREGFNDLCKMIDEQTGTGHLVTDSDQAVLFMVLKTGSF